MKKEWYKKTFFVVILHLAGWAVFLIVPHLLRPQLYVAGRVVRQPFLTLENLASYSFLAFIFYLNAYWLIPKLLNKRKTWLYVTALFIIFAVSFGTSIIKRRPPEFRQQFHEFQPPRFEDRTFAPRRDMKMIMRGPLLLPTFFVVVFVLAISTTYRFIIDRVRLNELQQQQKTEHLKTELTFLRSQISPHFIFNILNNIVSLARTNSEQIEPTLIKLSGLMRYMLYGADDEKVPLTQEVNYLENYIDLQRLRFGDDVKVVFVKSGTLFGYGIEPMLLIPFVENAFKHGVGNLDEPEINIRLSVEHGRLTFNVSNKFDTYRTDPKDNSSGIGLANVKKRLNLIYGDEYSLHVSENGNTFTVQLKLTLK